MISPISHSSRRYVAFLSYRHADNREEGRHWAEWLHQSLETYDVPHDLVGKVNLRGQPGPDRLYPIFRDEEELPADADLSQNVRRALENSDLLIVLCSPRACQSRFVAEEIRYFKELGKSDRILALMIDGEPNADDPAKAAQGITLEMECFPGPLRYGKLVADGKIDWSQRTEPIAADVRPMNRPGQGYTSAAAYRTALERAHGYMPAEVRRMEKAFAAQLDLARLKLTAGLLGVSLGELTTRDAVYRARKLRQLAMSLGSLALAALVAAGLAVWQWTAANKQKIRAEVGESSAVAARREAENLIKYMQGDLHDKLDGVGRLDLMDDVNARIRRYQQEHTGDARDPASRDDDEKARATAALQDGDVLLARGHWDEGFKRFQEAQVILDALVARDPNLADSQYALLVCGQREGRALYSHGDLAAARDIFTQGLATLRKFAERNPADTAWQRALAVDLADL